MARKREIEAVLAAMLAIIVMAGTAHAARPESQETLHRVSAIGVAAALAAYGVAVRPDRVEFLAPVNSIHPEPALEIERLQAKSPDSALARIRCRDTRDCLPFYVMLHFADDRQALMLIEHVHPASNQVHTAPWAERPDWVLRRGQKAIFVLQGRNVRATTPVICLENGRQGQSIRVSSLDGKRFMVGEIVGPGLLHGVL